MQKYEGQPFSFCSFVLFENNLQLKSNKRYKTNSSPFCISFSSFFFISFLRFFSFFSSFSSFSFSSLSGRICARLLVPQQELSLIFCGLINFGHFAYLYFLFVRSKSKWTVFYNPICLTFDLSVFCFPLINVVEPM